jgi:iron complex transport system substrate-binding protein
MRVGRRLLGIAVAAGALMLPGVLAAADAAPNKPVRIVSMSQCTDMLLLQLVPRERVASVTYLAAEAAEAIAPGLGKGVPINHGAAEELLAQRPDLILAGDLAAPMTRRIASKLGAPIVVVKTATTFAEIRANVRQVGAAVGEPARAETIIATMDRELAALNASAPKTPYRIVLWTGDSVPGTGTLANSVIAASGAVNIAARNTPFYDSFGVEDLMRTRPEALIFGHDDVANPSLTEEALQHRLVRTLYAGRQVAFPESLLNCGVPQSAKAAAALRGAFQRITGR